MQRKERGVDQEQERDKGSYDHHLWQKGADRVSSLGIGVVRERHVDADGEAVEIEEKERGQGGSERAPAEVHDRTEIVGHLGEWRAGSLRADGCHFDVHGPAFYAASTCVAILEPIC
ncbi:MAG: hypothetical protein E6K74_11555 [Candidatus Eisenbacteria bacterium]|uniref:Uncharacterized protein n=1 Tax=Eiseniibacteriota bacterium TaxID=2212470 RepID=A0A538SN15_UNCEI|nr:MAG: hypothetical protein E6K74_11555 [Candidatus Eisenbacteria bacterium]